MFTGIVEDIGQVLKVGKKEKEAQISIGVNKIEISEVKLGESISVNGTCLTVVSTSKSGFSVEVSYETLSRTNLSNLLIGSKVNLERSLKVGKRLGGHIVTGHIDGIGKVESVVKKGDSLEVWILLPEKLSKYIVEKGSVAVDGVSLTINIANRNKFSVNLIPYTQQETVFSEIKVGQLVNVECDIIGKYVEKFVHIKKNNEDCN